MFKVGGRVLTPIYGAGTVVVITDIDIGVKHDVNQGLHHLGGLVESGYGWWYLPHHLTKVKPAFKGNIK